MSFLNTILSSIGDRKGESTAYSSPPANVSRGREVQEITFKGSTAKSNACEGGKANHVLSKRPPGVVGSIASGKPKPSRASPSHLQKTATSSSIRHGQSDTSFGMQKASSVNAGSFTTANEAPKVPKKGSYKEIMARAQSSQVRGATVGVINHKPKSKMGVSHKRELKLRQKALKERKMGIGKNNRTSFVNGTNIDSNAAATADAQNVQDSSQNSAKQRQKLQPSYKGTMITASVGKKKSDRPSFGEIMAKVDSSECLDVEDEIDEDRYEYHSEFSDDMEAGFSDVEMEESATARLAKVEDDNEARLEARARFEKMQKKRIMAQGIQKIR